MGTWGVADVGLLEVLLIFGPRTQAFFESSSQLGLGLTYLAVGLKRHAKLAISAYCVIGFALIAWFLKSPEIEPDQVKIDADLPFRTWDEITSRFPN